MAAGPSFGVEDGAAVGDPRRSSGSVTFGDRPAAADPRTGAGALGAGWPGRTAAAAGVWPPGAEGAPFAPGTGKAFVLGGWLASGGVAPGVGWPGFPATAGAFAGCGALSRAVGLRGPGNLPPGDASGRTTAGLTDALGGRGAFPCWIKLARVATAAGNAGPTTAGPGPGRPPGLFAPGPAATFGAAGLKVPDAGRALMTLLITVVL